MCPAANGDASGGTPAAGAASGGHIKKGAWVTAHDAALVGLAQVIPGPLSRALPYCYENKADECVDGKEGPEQFIAHGSVLALVAPLLIHGALQAGVSDGDEKEQYTDASHQGADDAQQVEEEVAHGQTPIGGTFATARICFILWRWRYEGYGLRGRMSGLCLLLAALNALMKRAQLVGGLIGGLGRAPAGQITDRGLIHPHEYRYLRLSHGGGAEVLNEFGPVHGKTLWVVPYGLSHSFFLSQC